MTRLQLERLRRGFTQTDLGYMARMSQGQISLLERRRMLPPPAAVERVARVLGIESARLLDEVPMEEPASLSGGIP